MRRLLISTLLMLCAAGILGAAATARLPLAFEPNQGQYPAPVLFSTRSGDSRVWLTRDEAVFSSSNRELLRMQFLGASGNATIRGTAELAGKLNYLVGASTDWHTAVPTYARVRYQGIYPGIDLEFYGTESGRLEYDFIVAPGADPSQIRLRLTAAGGIEADEHGALISRTRAGELVQQSPVVYQVRDGERVIVAGRYQLQGDTLRFDVEGYDPAHKLVIDPVVEFASYLGGSGNEEGRGIALDADGNIYLTGSTGSANFPTANPLQGSPADNQADAYVTKISADGSTMLWSTFLGGTSGDAGRSIAVDGTNAVYIGGTAGPSFPATDGTQSALQGDSFLAKLSPDGQTLVYATYVAAARADLVTAIAVDESGALYATGRTTSNDFPTTAGAVQTTRPATTNTNDAFVIKLNPQGTRVYSTLVGGSDNDIATAIALKDGSAYIAGSTESPDFPVTAGVFGAALGGPGDAFVAKLNPAGSAYAFATYFGGTNNIDEAFGIALDVFGDIYLTGTTNSNNFPVTEGAFQPTRGSSVDGFAAKLNASATQILYATYLGGGNVDHLNSIAVDLHGAAYIAGQSQGSYPVTASALQAADNGGSDLVLTKLGYDGRRLLYSSFLGGAGIERTGQNSGDGGGNTIVSRNCMAYLTGRSLSTDFPTASPLQATAGGADDTVFAKIDPTARLGEPQIACEAGLLANLIPSVRQWVPGSIATIFGDDFNSVNNTQPALGGNGLVSTVQSNSCVEVNRRRSPMYHTLGNLAPNPDQLSFQVPVETELGWAMARVIGGCGTANETASEPFFIEIVANAPAFFIFTNLGLDPLHIAAVNDTQSAAAGRAVFVGPASAGGSWKQAKVGDRISLYFTGGGASSPGLVTGQIPVGLNPLIGDVSVTIGEVPATVIYAGEAPGVPGQGQLIVTVPNLPSGIHEVVFTVNGASTPGGVIAVE